MKVKSEILNFFGIQIDKEMYDRIKQRVDRDDYDNIRCKATCDALDIK